MTEKEKKKWLEDKETRKTNFIPQQFDSLREVPLYKNLIKYSLFMFIPPLSSLPF